jgi:hypothetical protein
MLVMENPKESKYWTPLYNVLEKLTQGQDPIPSCE